MKLTMPKDTKDPEQQNKAKASGALTIMLGKGNKVYYYQGELKVDASNFTASNFKDIRQVIIDKKAEVVRNHVHDEKCPELQDKAKKKGDPNWQNACLDRDFVVILKPDKDATYRNTVDILDEMTINGVKRYALVDITPVEEQLIARTEQASGIK